MKNFVIANLMLVFSGALILSLSGCENSANPFNKVKNIAVKGAQKISDFVPSSDEKPHNKKLDEAAEKSFSKNKESSPKVTVVTESAFNPLLNQFIPQITPNLPENSPIDTSSSRVIFTTAQLLEAEPYQHLLIGHSEYSKRKAAFDDLAKNPDPKAEGALKIVLKTEGDPFSGCAIPVLAKMKTSSALWALENALSDSRATIRASALIELIKMKKSNAGKICHDALAMDKSSIVKSAAAVGIGGLKYRQARGTLYMAVQKGVPMVRIFSAWAIYELGDEKGRVFLENVASSQDNNLSPQAMVIIAMFKDERSVKLLLQNLGSSVSQIWIPAYFLLKKIPEKILADKLDLPYPDVKEGKYFINTLLKQRRRAALLAIELSFPAEERILQARYSLLNEIVAGKSSKELQLMSTVLAINPSNRAVEALIRSMEVVEYDLAEKNRLILSAIAEKYNLTTPPNSVRFTEWRIWWIKNCTANVVKDSRSRKLVIVIKSPGGIDYFAAENVMIVPGVTVVKSEKSFRKGLELTVKYQDRYYQIKEAH